MKVSERLENITPELKAIDQMAQENFGIKIKFVIETGKETKKHEKRVKDFIETQDGYYDHRPRKYISIYPNIQSITHVLLNKRDVWNTMGQVKENKNTVSEVIDDMLRELGNGFLLEEEDNLPKNRSMRYKDCKKEGSIYNSVLLELDTNYVKRMSDLKNKGGEVLEKFKRDILTALEDIQTDYPALAKRVTNNILSNIFTIKNIENNFKYKDNIFGVGKSNNSDGVDENKMIHEKRFLLVMDVALAWYINHKIVHQEVLNHDLFQFIDKYYFGRGRIRDINAAVFFKRMVEMDIDTDDKLINILLRRLEMMIYDPSAFEIEELKYKPVFFNDPRREEKPYLESEDSNKTSSDLYQESVAGLVSFDYSVEDTLEFMADCIIADSSNLVAEGILDIFKTSDTKRITKMAREVDQAQVEFEFMYDKYSKADAMHNAYDVLEDINKALDKVRDRKSKEALESMREQLLTTIKKYRDKNTKRERMTVNINYPPGYEG